MCWVEKRVLSMLNNQMGINVNQKNKQVPEVYTEIDRYCITNKPCTHVFGRRHIGKCTLHTLTHRIRLQNETVTITAVNIYSQHHHLRVPFSNTYTHTLVPQTSTHNVNCIRETQSPAAVSPFPKKCKLFCAPFQSAIVTQCTLCKCTVNTVQHRIQNIMSEEHIAHGTYTVHSLFK